jgi:hypothetical protein
MSNHISLLLDAEAANRRLAQLLQSDKFERATHQSTAIVTRDSSGAARSNSKQNSMMSRENRRERSPVRSRTITATPTIGSGDTKRDLTVSSFMLALVLVSVVVAAHTDHPVFWLLVGPTPFVLHTTRTFLRQRVIRREGSLMFCKRDRLCRYMESERHQGRVFHRIAKLRVTKLDGTDALLLFLDPAAALRCDPQHLVGNWNARVWRHQLDESANSFLDDGCVASAQRTAQVDTPLEKVLPAWRLNRFQRLDRKSLTRPEVVGQQIAANFRQIPARQVSMDAAHESGVVTHIGWQRAEKMANPVLMLYASSGANALLSSAEFAGLQVAQFDPRMRGPAFAADGLSEKSFGPFDFLR